MKMNLIVCNPQKGSLETIAVELTADNTTWFENCGASDDITMITDYEGDLLVSENSWGYPVRIYEASRASIGYNRKKAKELRRRALA